MENQLQIIVKESGLEQSKAKFILENFQNYFEIADDWAKKARAIVVTDENQKAEMQMARAGRLFLREKRIAVEDARKNLKEQALREGKAIDGIANVLKALIIPIEEYLEKQEKFVEIREENKREAMRIEIEKRIEDERIAKEKADAEEREKIRQENERLKKEAEEKEKALQAERKKVEAEKQEAERKAKESQEKLRKEAEEKAKKIRKENDAKLLKEKLERERIESEKKEIEEMLKNQVECPKCHHKFKPHRKE